MKYVIETQDDDEAAKLMHAQAFARLLADLDEKLRATVKYDDASTPEVISYADDLRKWLRGEIGYIFLPEYFT